MSEARAIQDVQGKAASIGLFWRGTIDGRPCFSVILPPGGVENHFNPARGDPPWNVSGELPGVTVTLPNAG